MLKLIEKKKHTYIFVTFVMSICILKFLIDSSIQLPESAIGDLLLRIINKITLDKMIGVPRVNILIRARIVPSRPVLFRFTTF